MKKNVSLFTLLVFLGTNFLAPISYASDDVFTINSIDGKEISIMKEDAGSFVNQNWDERAQGPCPEGYHVPTMEEWNTLFVSWCEMHSIQGDGLCDLRDLDRINWEYGKDFLFRAKSDEIVEKFGEEMNIKDFDSDLMLAYDYDLDPVLDYVGMGAYRTSTPHIKGDVSMGYFYVNVGYYGVMNPIFQTEMINNNNTPEMRVRCFSDDYSAPQKILSLDLIDKDDINEFKELEQKIRSGEMDLPSEKQTELWYLMALSQQGKDEIYGGIEIVLSDINNDIDSLDGDEKQYLLDLKDLLEDVINATDDNKQEILDKIHSFEWREFWGDIGYYQDYSVYLEYYLGARDSLTDDDILEELDEIIADIKGDIDNIFSGGDFFDDWDKENLYLYIDMLEDYEDISDIITIIDGLYYETEDLFDRYETELVGKKSILDGLYRIKTLVDTSLSLLEINEFVEEARDYLGTDNWLNEDGTIDYEEMVTQEYLQEEFAKIGYRVMLTSEMSANDIREKIANIKGITLGSDEYLALFDVNQEEINIDRGVNKIIRGYVEPKKIEKEEGNGRSGGGGGGGGGSSNKTDTSKEDKTQTDTTEQTSQNDKQEMQDSSEQVPQKDVNTSIDSQQTKQASTNTSEGQTYTQEFQKAYEFAKGKGITTMPTIQKADMNGKLTRIAMAKMLSQYAVNILGKTPDVNNIKKFDDVSDERDAKYDNGVTLAYQLGIMGQNMTNKFRPDDEVTRAEFATALSRMLYGTSDGQYESTPEYYTNHINKLKEEGIMTKVDPKMKELRGYVMIMLMRSAK